jgi:hypothetical protein
LSLYLYAVLESPPPAPAPARVRYVACAGLTAAVRDARAVPAPRTPALRRHAQVVHALWEASPALLPARFGALMADEAELARALVPRRGALREALALVRGRAQMTLRVFATRGTPPAPPEAATGTEYLAGRAAWWRAADVPGLAALLEALRPLRAAERMERHGQPPLTASVYHLVDRARVGDYRRLLARSRGRLRVRVSGPWPPYAFAAEVGA